MKIYKSLIVSVFVLSLSGGAFAKPSDGTILAYGTADISVAPDIANLTLTIETKAKTLKAASDENVSASQEALGALVNQFNLQRGDFRNTINQREDTSWVNNTTVHNGYVVTNTITVKIRQLDQIGAAIDTIVAKGGKFGYASYGLENSQPIKEKALEKAVLNAKANAAAALSALGKTVGEALGIVQSGAQATVFRAQAQSAEIKGMAAPALGGAPVSPTQVDSGQVTVSASVSVLFEMK